MFSYLNLDKLHISQQLIRDVSCVRVRSQLRSSDGTLARQAVVALCQCKPSHKHGYDGTQEPGFFSSGQHSDYM